MKVFRNKINVSVCPDFDAALTKSRSDAAESVAKIVEETCDGYGELFKNLELIIQVDYNRSMKGAEFELIISNIENSDEAVHKYNDASYNGDVYGKIIYPKFEGLEAGRLGVEITPITCEVPVPESIRDNQSFDDKSPEALSPIAATDYIVDSIIAAINEKLR